MPLVTVSTTCCELLVLQGTVVKGFSELCSRGVKGGLGGMEVRCEEQVHAGAQKTTGSLLFNEVVIVVWLTVTQSS